jgi:hypothetical protein
MRSHSLKCGLVIGFMFLAVGLIAVAAPAAAAERSGTPKIDFIYPKDFEGVSLAIQDAPTPAAKASRLSVKLYGGYANILAGDVNEGSDYYFEILEYYQAEGLGTVTGSYKPLHGGYNFGGDVIYQLSPKLGLGLGVGYMRNSSSSVGTFSDGTESVTLTVAPTLTALPIRLSLFFTTPMSKKLNLTADAGAAYYAGLKLDATQGLEFSPTDWMEMRVEGSQRSGADIGFHGSLGVEYMLSPKMGFFVEAAGRYAKFNNFEIVTATTSGSGGSPDSTEGKLYIATDTIGTAEISGFTIVATGDPVDPSYREPKIDLSGFSLQIGIRIRL